MVEQYIFDVSVAAELEEVKHCEACEVGMATFVTILGLCLGWKGQ